MICCNDKLTSVALASLIFFSLPFAASAQVGMSNAGSGSESLSTEPILTNPSESLSTEPILTNPSESLSTEPILTNPTVQVVDSDGDGLSDDEDNCQMVPNTKLGPCDSDRDGYGNACDGDFNQDGATDGMDFIGHFLADFQTGVDSGSGTDMDCDGVVTGIDFVEHFLANFAQGTPGPAAPTSKSVVVATKKRTLGGETFVFEKRLGSDGNVWTIIRDSSGREVAETALPREQAPTIGEDLARLMQAATGRLIRVQVALELPGETPKEAAQTGEVETFGGRIRQARVNGEQVSEGELVRHEESVATALRTKQAERELEDSRQLQAWADRNGLGDTPGVKEALESTSTNLVLDLSPADIKRLAASKDGIVQGIELHVEGKDNTASAMAATNITNWALPFPNRRANGVGIYMTESGCAQEFRFANYDRLSGAETDHSRNVGGILKAVAPEHHLYCRGSAVLPTITDLYGALLNDLFPFSPFPELDGPRIQVVTRSNGAPNGNGYGALDRDWDNFVYAHMIPTFLASGNEGSGTGSHVTPAKGLNVVSVGNYNDATNTIAGNSSFVDPTTGNVKPEISAPGTNITAGGFTKSGTSMATPHAAAFVADQMSDSTWLKFKPHLVKAKIISAATDPIAGGFDKVGLGGIDFLSGHYNGYNYWWSGNNGAFAGWDAADGSSDGYVERSLMISNSWDSVRVVLSWLTRGTYTYANRTDAHPIGIDLDLRVYDPSGSLVGSSASWDNNFESVQFTPTVSGTYTFKIRRFANRDTANKLRMGLVVNYFN